MRRSTSRRVAMLTMISAYVKSGRFAGALSSSNRPQGVGTRSRSAGATSVDAVDDAGIAPPRRTFQFVPFGATAPAGVTTISCDGLVSGSTFDVTHWTNNQTPDDIYADTSTEIAINLAKAERDNDNALRQRYSHLMDAVILNNHYDTDGALSVFSCLHPEVALRHEPLLIAAAEAGDFGEWNSDAGVKLDCALLSLKDGCETDEEAYDEALKLLPDLLHDVESHGGKYESLWRTGFNDAMAGYHDLLEGRAGLSRGPGTMVIVNERPGSQLSQCALHRGMVESDLWKGTTRVLRVDTQRIQDADDNRHRYRYQYEKVGHGWVTKLKDRWAILDADGVKLAKAMGSAWSKGGHNDFVSISQSTYVADSPEEVSNKLWKLDPGCQ